MARSPFQGTWQDGVRPTIVTAPDALVYINGQPNLTACNNCRRSFDLNKYITSLQVDLSVDNAPGSANFSLSIPRHSVDDFCVDGEPLIANMMEVEIYAKGYYLINGVPQYYPIFWGLVTDVSEAYSSGEHTFNVSCADILKWWEVCRLNITPSFTQPGGQLGKNLHQNAFHGCNVYDVIWTLARQSFGDVLQTNGSFASVDRENFASATFSGLRKDIMAYWAARFGKMRSSLLLYGVRGAGVRGDSIYASQSTGTTQTSQTVASTAVRNANGGAASGSQILFDPINDVFPFRSNISNSGNPNLWQSEFQTKLELANTCKEAVGFEFFMDVTGDIVFKPPFYNLDVLSNKPVSWIQDIDIIDWDFSESESEVITQLQIQGTADGGEMDLGITSEVNTPYTQVTDYHLLRQYGWRAQTFNADFLETSQARFYAGVDMLDKINSRRHRGTIGIPLRPELRLGFPVYITPKDQIWYLSGISHSIQFGGRAQTTLTLTAKRGKFIAPKGIGTIELKSFDRSRHDSSNDSPLINKMAPNGAELSLSGRFEIKVGAAAETPPTPQQTNTRGDDPYSPLILRHPKTGRIVGYPNVNMAYTRPYDPTSAESNAQAGGSTSDKRKAPSRGAGDKTAAKSDQDLVASVLTQNSERDLLDKHLNNRYTYGMTSAGVYTYVHEITSQVSKTKVIQEILQVPIDSKITVSSATGTQLASERVENKARDGFVSNGTATIRPVSDERGFEVVGHYRYGRGISLRDGALVLSNGGNTQVTVDTQLALSGGLFEVLTAQSQGLTTLTSSYANPAVAIARLTADDMQTAATLNPTTGRAAFTSAGENRVETATLDSPANRGTVASVEVGQLSRALTLAEMRVKEDVVPNVECACLLGRADLAFINVGYEVKFLKGTQPDLTSSINDSIRRNRVEIQRLETTETTQLQAEIDKTQTNLRVLTAASRSEERDALIIDVQAQVHALRFELGRVGLRADALKVDIDDLMAQDTSPDRTFIGDAFVRDVVEGGALPIAEATRPIASGLTMTKVEKFLADLYETLDGSHQQYEDALRGNLIEGRTRESLVSGTSAPVEQFSPFSPPFSAGSRARGGDPAALALQGSSAMSGLTQSWKDFGENLQKRPQKTALEENITNLESDLRQLDAEEERLRQPGSVILSPDGTVSQRLGRLTEERSKATRELGNARAKLRQLENSQ